MTSAAVYSSVDSEVITEVLAKLASLSHTFCLLTILKMLYFQVCFVFAMLQLFHKPICIVCINHQTWRT